MELETRRRGPENWGQKAGDLVGRRECRHFVLYCHLCRLFARNAGKHEIVLRITC